MNRFNANMTSGMFKEASHSLDMEADVELAREAAPGLIKTIDGMAVVSPENRTLLELSAQAYCSYAFGFLEDDLERVPDGDPRFEPLRARTTALYRRCQDYGERLLHLSNENFPGVLQKDTATLEAAVKRLDDADDDVPGLFWTGLGLASQINLNRDNLDLVGDLPKAAILMRRVIDLNPRYYNAGAHIALGNLHAAQGKAVGGDPARARQHYDQAIALTEGKFLLARVMLARVFAVNVQDKALYVKTLQDVLATPADIWPAQRLANEIARGKAARYLKQADELF
jgi:hypothetical protein